MPFNDDIPTQGTQPWYIPFKTTWDNLKAFVNGLETAIGSLTNSVSLKYTRPDTGIPSTDLTAAAQTSLGKADSAVQSIPTATAGEVQTGTEAAKFVTPATLSARTATETRAGIAEIATLAEALSGLDDARFITPAKAKAIVEAAVADIEEPAAPAIPRTNLFRDPLATSLTRFSGALNYTPSLVTGFPVPTNLQDIVGGATVTAVRSTRTATGAARIACPVLAADMPNDGGPITFYMLIRAGKDMTVNVTARPAVATSTNATSLGAVPVTTTPQLAVFTAPTYSVADGASAGISLAIGSVTSVDANDWVEVTLVGVEAGTVPVTAAGDERPIFGSRAATGRATYAWLGTADDSHSTQTPVGGGTSGELEGLFHIEKYGAVPDGPNCDAALAEAIADANAAGGAVYAPRGRRYYGKFAGVNMPLRVIGGGTFVQEPGQRVFNIAQTELETITLTSMATDTVGPATTNDGGKPSNRVTRLNVAAANLVKFQPRDAWLIRSEDTYPWSNRPTGGTSAEYPVGNPVYMQDWITMMGVVLPFAPSGTHTIREGDTIVGSTSGAQAQVIAHHATQLLVRMKSGTFTTTEAVAVNGTQGGTLNGAGWVAVQGLVDGTYATNPQLLRMPDHQVELDVTIEASGDPDAVNGLATREPAIRVVAAKRADIKARVRSTWQAGILLVSTYHADVDLKIDAAPNITVSGGSSSNIATEGAYGYGIETIGCVVGGTVNPRATGVRHAFSTNVQEWTSYPSGSSRLLNGVARDVVVSGVAHDTFAAGFDTHEGSQRIIFRHCINWRTLAGGRYAAGTNGFNNRSLNTRFEFCVDFGSVVGFVDGSCGHNLGGGRSVVEFVNCASLGFLMAGFRTSLNKHATDVHLTRFENVRARGNGSQAPSASPYAQRAFELTAADIEIIGAKVERFNSDAVLILGSGATTPANIIINNLTADFSESPNSTGVDLIRIFSGTNVELTRGNVHIIQRTDQPALPAAGIRFQSGNPVVRFFGEQVTLNTGNLIPRWTTDGGTPTRSYAPGAQPRSVKASAAPADILDGDLWIDTSATPALKVRHGGAWVSL